MMTKDIQKTQKQLDLALSETTVGSLLNLEDIHQRHGIFDERLFHSDHKITYTFLDEHEVICLHFDKQRQAVFLKGRKLDKENISSQEQKYVELFYHVLRLHPHGQNFREDFERVYLEFISAED